MKIIRKHKTTIAVLILVTAFLFACGGGGSDSSDSNEPDIYEYVTGWELELTGSINGFNLYVTEDYVFASVSRIGADSIYWYEADGTYHKDIIAEITDDTYKPKQPMGIVYYSGNVYLADQFNTVWKINPVNPGGTNCSLVIIDYGTRYVFGLALKGTDIYTAHADTLYTEWTIERRNSGDAASDKSVTLSGDGHDFSYGIAADANGILYAADTESGKIYKYSSDMIELDNWEVNETNSSFDAIYGVAVSSDGSTVFAVDTNNYRVRVFDSEGNYLGKFGSKGTGNGQFTSAWGIAVSSDGYVYVGDWQLNSTDQPVRIQKFKAK